MVALAAGSSSRSTEISYQTKITTVMLGYFYFDEEAHRRAVNNQAADYGTSLGSPCSD
jgi:hypothetical protein